MYRNRLQKDSFLVVLYRDTENLLTRSDTLTVHRVVATLRSSCVLSETENNISRKVLTLSSTWKKKNF